MTHTIDTKAIQKLAAMSPEAKAYLEREFPQVFKSKIDHKTRYYISENNDGMCLMMFKGVDNPIKKGWKLATSEEIQRFIPDYKPNI